MRLCECSSVIQSEISQLQWLHTCVYCFGREGLIKPLLYPELQCLCFNIQCVLLSYPLGPYGERDDQQVFVQKVVPETDQVFVRLASNGKRYFIIYSKYCCLIVQYAPHWHKSNRQLLLYFINWKVQPAGNVHRPNFTLASHMGQLV